MWIVDGNLMRHYFDGRTIDVEWWKVEANNGVTCAIAHTNNHGNSWVIEP